MYNSIVNPIQAGIDKSNFWKHINTKLTTIEYYDELAGEQSIANLSNAG